MNRRNEARKRESVHKLEEAFCEELETKPLVKITVAELCKKTGLNRSTFYANYVDIYALADSIREQLENNMLEMHRLEFRDAAGGRDGLHLMRTLLEHIQKNQRLYRIYFKLGYDRDNNEIIRRSEAFGAPIVSGIEADRFDLCKDIYHRTFFKAGFTEVIRLWLDRDCQETPEQIISLLKSEYQGRIPFFQD